MPTSSRRSTRGRRAAAASCSIMRAGSPGQAQARAPADLPAAGMGRARRGGDLGARAGRDARRRRRRPGRARTTSPPSASRTSARRSSSGTRRRASRSATRSSGRTCGPRTPAGDSPRDGGIDRFQALHGASGRDLLLRAEARLDARERRGSPRAGRSRRPARGHDRRWLVWNLTGGPDGGVHATDVTNASRTLCMDLRAGAWSDAQLDLFGIPKAMLPDDRGRRATPTPYGTVRIAGPVRRRARSRASSATSRRRSSGRPASRRATPRRPTGPGASS